jgi:1-acyl-sn-glycerol-3-phosphate acyltransferase
VNPSDPKPVRYCRSIWRLTKFLFTSAQASLGFAWRSLRSGGRLSPKARAEWLHEWCAVALPRIKVSIETQGPLPQDGLLVSNHLSYLDILVYSAVMPCGFVAKKEVRSWPIYGSMSRMAGTVFIDREVRSDTRRANDELAASLTDGALMVLYAEGTSSDGSSVLPFRPSLFEPAVRGQFPITPAYITYQLEDGDVGQELAYWGEMHFLPHLLNLLTKRSIRAQVCFASEGRTYGDRKAAAATCHQIVMSLAGMKAKGGPDAAEEVEESQISK